METARAAVGSNGNECAAVADCTRFGHEGVCSSSVWKRSLRLEEIKQPRIPFNVFELFRQDSEAPEATHHSDFSPILWVLGAEYEHGSSQMVVEKEYDEIERESRGGRMD